MAKKLAVLLVEGDTEFVFYKRLINNLNQLNNGELFSEIRYINMHGIGGYCNKAYRKINYEVRPHYPGYKIAVFFCYDMDVFTYEKRPPVNWKEVEKALKELGIRCYHIKANPSIESWFLLDKENVCRYLRIPENTKLVGRSDYDKLTALFKRGNRVYVKGKNKRAEEFIDFLDISKIMKNICNQLKPLCKYCGIRCNEKEHCFEEYYLQD